jgi:dCTP deaminase
MLLSDGDIASAIRREALSISPWDDDQLQPASYDLRLGHWLMRFDPAKAHIVEVGVPRTKDEVIHHPELVERRLTGVDLMEREKYLDGDFFTLMPGELALGETLETISIGPTLAARLEGKSSLARVGVMAHATAGWVDPGWRGKLTLELMNAGPVPVRLYIGAKVAQICFFKLSSAVIRQYGDPTLGSHYQGQKGVMGAKL